MVSPSQSLPERRAGESRARSYVRFQHTKFRVRTPKLLTTAGDPKACQIVPELLVGHQGQQLGELVPRDRQFAATRGGALVQIGIRLRRIILDGVTCQIE